jgi:exonuclease III
MNISVISHNTARSNIVNQTILEIARAKKTDILLVQEPFLTSRKEEENLPAQHFDYYFIMNNSPTERPRAITYIRKQSNIDFTNRTDLLSDPDTVLIEIRSKKSSIYIINIYNEKDNRGIYTISRTLKEKLKRIDIPWILAGDLNAHHRWWNSRVKSSRNSKDLVD